MSTLPRVVLSEDISDAGKAVLRGRAELILAPDTTASTATRLLADADGLILRASTQITREVLSQTTRLRIIARTGVGYNNVDLAAATERGIPVTIVPGANEETVAEHAIAMVFALSKQIFLMDRAVREGNWAERFSPAQRELRGQTLGLIGYGNIGQRTAAKAAALGMNVLVFDPALSAAPLPSGISPVASIEQVLSQADFVSLHVPATPTTKQMINAARLAQMKPGAFLINTARGELVDETALLAALTKGQLAGAALDVFATEPPAKDNPLFARPEVILSPHVAGSTFESNQRLAIGAAQAVLDALEGRTPDHVVNPAILKQSSASPSSVGGMKTKE